MLAVQHTSGNTGLSLITNVLFDRNAVFDVRVRAVSLHTGKFILLLALGPG